MQDLTKTIKLRIYASDEQIIQLQQMTEQYRLACNFVSEYIFSHDFEMNSNKLNKILYHDIRESFGLKSQLAQSVFRTVTARYKTVQEQLHQKPYKFQDQYTGKWYRIPKDLGWLRKPIKFRRPQADLVRDRDYSFVDGGATLSLNTLGKRIKVNFANKHFAEYLDGSWNLGTGKIVELNGLWYIHIPVTRAVEEFSKENVCHVVGIDRGLRFLVATYDEQGKSEFFRGKQILHKRNKFIELRKHLQQKGTWSAKRALRRISGRENRWMTDVNHVIAKTLVEKYGQDTLFVIEDLAGVTFEENNLRGSAKSNCQKRSWAFYQLEQFLLYKAHENRSEVVKVDPWRTSQRCPKCGSVRKENRDHHLHKYHCQCGYESNDDRIGAMNIQMLGTLWISGNEKPSIKRMTAVE